MKKIIILLLTIFFVNIAQGQISLTLSMNPRPTASITNWSSRKDILTLIAAPPQQGGTRNVKINTVIKTVDGTTIATTDMLKAPTKYLNSGSLTIFSVADVINFEALSFVSSYQNKINKTGKLPAGNYQIIVKLDSANSPITVSTTQTKVFTLQALQLPVLIVPMDKQILNAEAAQTAITFRWTPLTPKPQDLFYYHIMVFEINENQTPMQALRSNQPLLDKEISGTTQYIWQPQLGLIDDVGKSFVWSIQTIDATGNPIVAEVANGAGISEAKTFTIRKKGWDGKIKDK